AAALAGAVVESLPTGINDNLSVPLTAGAFLFGMAHVDPGLLAADAPWREGLAAAAAVNAVAAAAALAARAVKPSGAAGGFVIGTMVFAFGGWRAYAVLLLFFVLGTGATRVGYDLKRARRIAQEEGGRRGARHAVANCGVAAFLAFLSAATPHPEILLLALTASLATAAFDTVSSEIGQVYGRRTFLITTFRPVPPGTEGAVSLEGTLAGAGAAAFIGAAAAAMGLLGPAGWPAAAVVTVAAFAGSTVESYMGASRLGGGMGVPIDNEAMNFTNTAVGAAASLALAALLLPGAA
ncbi:MAG TPA: DUF92 domain-containing protein, partial [Candidatus Polarisedimenticolia bacterium]|nr:DUF92 domain-containing protein [Candidatus Polarisedimenticolia bacterium]